MHDVCQLNKKIRYTYKILEISAKNPFPRTLCGGIEGLAFHKGGPCELMNPQSLLM